MKKLDLTKPVKTRDGREARIICTDRVGDNNIIALVKDEDGGEYAISCDETGKRWLSGECKEDLVNIPEKKVGWINIYSHRTLCRCYLTKEEADTQSNKHRVACARIEWGE